jgi:hypothetical protein
MIPMKRTIPRLIIPVAFALTTILCNAQSPSWQWATSLQDTDGYARSFNHADSKGNVYLTGFYSSASIPFGTITLSNSSPGKLELYVVKMNSFGSVIWAKSFGGAKDELINDMCVDAYDNVYVTGQFNSPVLALGGFSLQALDPDDWRHDIFVARLDPNGNVTNAFSAGGTGHDQGWGIAASTSGIYITGSFASATVALGSYSFTNSFDDGTSDYFIAKYDLAGNCLWAYSGGYAMNDGGEGIECDVSGNVYVSVGFANMISFGSQNFVTVGMHDYAIVKYDANGQVLWVNHYGGDEWDFSPVIATDQSNNLYFSGLTRSSSLVIGSDTVKNIPYQTTCFYAAKMNPAGSTIWFRSTQVRPFNNVSTYPVDVTVDNQGGLLVLAGFSSDTVSFGNWSVMNSGKGQPQTFKSQDILLSRFDANGNIIMFSAFGASLSVDWPGRISCDNNGGFYFSGSHQKSFMIGNAALTTTLGGYIPFIARYGLPNTVAVSEYPNDEAFIFPNPSGGSITIQFPDENKRQLRLFDPVGRIRKEWSVLQTSCELFIDDLTTGCYLLSVQENAGDSWTMKVIKQ